MLVLGCQSCQLLILVSKINKAFEFNVEPISDDHHWRVISKFNKILKLGEEIKDSLDPPFAGTTPMRDFEAALISKLCMMSGATTALALGAPSMQ